MNGLKVFLLVLVIIYLVGGLVLFFLQDRLIFLPEPTDKDHQYTFEEPFEEVNLKMTDGAIINALYFAVETPKGLIVYFHGNAGNLERWGEIVTPFVRMGYEVLVYDYRGYGKSTGTRSDRKLLSDAEEIYAYAQTLQSEDQIILFGRSLGSTFASYLGGKNSPMKIILETPFYSLKDVANTTIPIYPTSKLLSYQFKSFQYLENAKSPIFIFHGTEDEIVPYESGVRLYESTDGKAELITIDGGHHNDLALYDVYWDYMQKIL